ncbi:MAG TPA: hypothetical protein PLE54_11425 [Burkholderiaceae bacterium]|nr:hypothetical protein [Burkholderiaceae bacterium]HQR71207.1 hypothetical protein [Burkholderiaceae bacterium]
MGVLIGRCAGVVRALALFLLFGAGAAFAAAETWDVITFDAPAGNRQAGPEGVGFSESTPTTFVTYAVYKSARSSGDPARDFQDEWKLLMGQYRLTGELKSGTGDWAGGWKLTMGTARVWSEQQRNFTSVLSVFTGYGVKASILINYNDDRYKPQIDRFVASWRLQPPAVEVAPTPAGPPPAAQGGSTPPGLTAHEWYRSVASYSQWGTNFSGLEIAKIGNQGSSKWWYRFLPDGTYSFVNEFWSLNKSNEYWAVEESGTYRADERTIQVNPTRVQRVLRDRDGRPQGQPQALALEPMTYRYAFQYLSGMQRWYLVLMPDSGRDTNRDGTRNAVPDFGPAYRYGPRPYCEQRPRPADCKG